MAVPPSLPRPAPHRAVATPIPRRTVLRGAGALAATGLRRDGLRLTFEERFDRLDLYDERTRTGRWQTQYGYAGLDSHDSRCTAAGEACYVDAGFTGGLVDPFRIADDGGTRCLEITAARTPDALRDRCFGQTFTSGLLTTWPSFAQLYGVFEAAVRVPAGRGYFPAFWGLPRDHSWSSEFDVFESLGEPHLTHMGVKTDEPGVPPSVPATTAADLSAGYHRYALRWDAETVAWFVDDAELRRVRTPRGAHRPFFWLFNLAIGGQWAGTPPADTPFPAALRVAWFRAYQFS